MVESMLLAEYARDRSPQAFGRLVEQYIDLVYAAARRQLMDAHLAEDVTQAVFILLAKKAKEIPTDRPLSAWLLTTTRYVVANMRREVANRQKHERKASAMKIEPAPGPDDSKTWGEVSPFLDEGLANLNESDRDVLLLRFFESKTLREVGDEIGISEDAAEKRIARAIDRLRAFFASKGVGIAGTALTLGLSQRLLFETPKGLASTILQGGHAGSAVVSKIAAGKAAGTITTLTTIKIGVSVVIGIAVIWTGVAAVQHMDAKAPAATAPAQNAVPLDLAANDVKAPASQPSAYGLYELKPDEPLQIVRDAPTSARQAMWTRLQFPQKASPSGEIHVFTAPAGPFAFDWNNGNPQGPIAFAPGQQLPLDHVIKNLVVITTTLELFEIELPADLPKQMCSIPGDIVYTNLLPIDKALAGVEAVIRRELNVPLKLSLQSVDRKVFVLRGKFTFKRLLFKEPGNAPMMGGRVVEPLIEVYGSDVFDPNDTVAGGALFSNSLAQDPGSIARSWLARNVSSWVGDREIIIEAEDFPATIGWRAHVPKPGVGIAAEIAHDPARVLTNICQQTGLTWTEETRQVRRVIVSLDVPK
jgi:RNA polymerase sigma factor (sigma-70 family)